MRAPEPTPALAGTEPAVLEVRALSKRYATLAAVDGVDFSVAPGEIVGLVGPNGAGKTTTINMILGVLEASEGTILIEGHDVQRSRSAALARVNFAAVYAPLPGNLSVWQNLRVFGLLYAVPELSARIEALLEQLDLRRYRDTRCGVLSSGEQTRVCLAKALLNRPRLLLLDEPTASIDPASARDIRSAIRAIAQDQRTGMLWTSHNMAEVERVCDRVLLMSHGRILLQGDPRTLPAAHGADSLEDLFVRIAREPVNGELP